MSQQPPGAVRRQLGAAQKWRIVGENKGPTDGRPRFDFVEVSVGQMADFGQTGDVVLTFYNDRLMCVYFTPADPSTYFGTLSHLPGARPHLSGAVVVPGGAHVRRVGARPAEGPVIQWYDPCLQDEQTSWIMKYS